MKVTKLSLRELVLSAPEDPILNDLVTDLHALFNAIGPSVPNAEQAAAASALVRQIRERAG